MRARSLKPGFFKNENLALSHPLGRILFSGLWCMADRMGRLEDRPKRIKAEVLPYDNCNIEKLLSDLHQKQFITRYAANGEKYIQINNFLKHQNPHCREPESQIPAPVEHCASTMLGTALNVLGPADSPFLTPDSPFLTPDKAASDDSSLPSPVLLTLPLVSKNGDGDPQEFPITQHMVSEWQGLFPALDVCQVLRDIRAWNLANPRNRKTRAGILRHITGWLAKDQNRARAGPASVPRGRADPPTVSVAPRLPDAQEIISKWEIDQGE